jgi:hypothetical protein
MTPKKNAKRGAWFPGGKGRPPHDSKSRAAQAKFRIKKVREELTKLDRDLDGIEEEKPKTEGESREAT